MKVKISGKTVSIPEVSVLYKPLNVDLVINCPEDAAEFLQNVWYPGLMNVQKLFYVIYLDDDLKVLCWHLLNTGTSTSSHCDKKLIAITAFENSAKCVIIAHNNTTGKVKISAEEKKCYKDICNMLELLNINFMDYLILNDKSYSSLFL